MKKKETEIRTDIRSDIKAALEQTKSTKLPLTHIEGLKPLVAWGTTGGSRFACAENVLARKKASGQQNIFFVEQNSEPLVDVELNEENIEKYKAVVKKFNESLQTLSRRIYAGSYSDIDTEDIRKCYDYIRKALKSSESAEQDVIEKILESIITPDYQRDYSPRHSSFYLHSLHPVTRVMRMPDTYSFTHQSRYNTGSLLRAAMNTEAPNTLTAVDILTFYGNLMSVAGAFVDISDIVKINHHEQLRILSALRRNYGSMVIHFVRTGKFDIQMYEHVVDTYVSILTTTARNAANEIRLVLERLSEVNWLTSNYIFESVGDMFLSQIANAVRGNSVYGKGDPYDDGLPF